MKIPARISAALALVGVCFSATSVASAVGAYDNGILALLTPLISFGIVVIGPIFVVVSICVAVAIWGLTLLSSLAVVIVGNRSPYKMVAKVALYVLSVLLFFGLLLAITNFGDLFVKGEAAERVHRWALAFPAAFALIASLL
jgi:hypothetical protein